MQNAEPQTVEAQTTPVNTQLAVHDRSKTPSQTSVLPQNPARFIHNTEHRLAHRHAGIGPANPPNPHLAASTLQAPLLLAKVADRAAEADTLPARAARRLREALAVQIHAVAAAVACQARAAVLAARRGQELVVDGRRRSGGSGGVARCGVDVPELMEGLLVVCRGGGSLGMLRQGGFLRWQLLVLLGGAVEQGHGVLCKGEEEISSE